MDDFGGAEVGSQAEIAFEALGQTLKSAGLAESPEKASPPCTRMMFLGVMFDTVRLRLEIDEGRVHELLDLMKEWLVRKAAKRKELESVLGKVMFVASCVRPGRIFVSRLLNFLWGLPRGQVVKLDPEILRDFYWWAQFLPSYNGISMMPLEGWSNPDAVLATDSCLVGCGGVTESQFFHSTFPEAIARQGLHINALELLTLTVALKLWGSTLIGKRILVFCDNMASVQVLNSGASRDLFSQACLREVCWFAARYQFEVRGKHLPGVSNRLPDLLSRWTRTNSNVKTFFFFFF